MASEKGSRKEKNQNIQVFVRLRPLNQRERDIRSIGVVEVVNGREVLVKQSQQTTHTKRFTFDRAFGPNAKQVEVYQEVVSPLIEEVLAGYNCTVFAYGQTGTGKTHTMVGENIGNETTWQNDPLAGIIPRSLSQLFDELRLSNTEYTVRVSYLELYNEELFDLLSSSEDNSKLRIYEDVTRKGANIVNGLEEITVYNKNEVYKIMAQGQERKRVASTLMNAQSSIQQKEKQIPQFRSHTVFTIVVHMKENGPDGEELVKIGKLNLVDLAGSENISKAGSDNPAKRERARECVNINQSLLTLGRVITALVERHPHIPYRESKLTRILQESLGGRTKTSIIATVSPGHKDLEETMSTLEYANRAKNIQNKPEINQKMTKKAILKEYAEEIDRLKRDLQAARDKNGVYLANETFAEMTLKQEEQRKEIQDLLLRKRSLEEERDNIETMFNDHRQKLQARESELNNTRNALNNTKIKLNNTSNMLQTTKLQFEEQKHLVEYHQQTETALAAQAHEILAVADMATSHVHSLQDTVDKRKSVETMNLEITAAYRELSSQHRHYITSEVDNFVASLTNTFGEMEAELDTHTAANLQTYSDNQNTLSELVGDTTETMNKVAALDSELRARILTSATQQKLSVCTILETHGAQLQRALEQSSTTTIGTLQNVADMDLKTAVAVYLEQWYTSVASHVASLRSGQTLFSSNASSAAQQSAIAARRQYDARRLHRDRCDAAYSAHIAIIKEERAHAQENITKELNDLEMERVDMELHLTKWMEEERRLLEERIERHLTSQRSAFQAIYEKRVAKIEQQRREYEERVTHHLEWLEAMLRVSEQEIKSADGDLKENVEAVEKCLSNVENFKQLCDEEIGAVSASVGSLPENVLNVVSRVKTEMEQAVYEAKDVVTMGTNQIITGNQREAKQLAMVLAAMLEGTSDELKSLVNHIINEVKISSTSTIEQMSKLTSSMQELLVACRDHQDTQSSSLGVAQREQERFRANLREEVSRQEEIESRCLKEQYKVYSPSGGTPHRSEYRYPRRLPAASPHERVLARFRAMRRQASEDDCIVVESDENRTISDCESSCSEESGAFATPLPPATVATTPIEHPLVKCTSETDIYMRRRQDQQGKENVNRSMSFKKPSKLPAPAPISTSVSASNKRPLVDRNAH